MNRRLRRVVQAALNTPWAMLPDKLDALAEVLADRAAGGRLSEEDIRAAVGPGRAGSTPSGGGVAVLPLYGIVGHRMNQVQDVSGPGGTSTEQFGQWFDRALADESVSAILLDVDSPGGSVHGVEELARKIFDARGTKPIIAIANSLAASAAYWIASAADELVVTPSGDVGSIGVYAIHSEYSRADEADGVTHTIVRAGKHKAEANSIEPLSEEAREAMQERVDEMYQTFTKAVARHRGVTPKDVSGGFGEGRVVSARKAVALGMADRVATIEETVARLLSGKGAGRKGARAEGGDTGWVYVEANDGAPVPRTSGFLQVIGQNTTTTNDGTKAVTITVHDPARVGAVPSVVHDHATSPAPEAKEQTMSAPGTAAPDGAEKITDQRNAAESARVAALLALAAEFGRATSDVQRWVAGDVSVEQAQREILKEKAASAAPAIRVTPLDGGDNGTKAGPFRTLGEQLVAIREHRPGQSSPSTQKLFQVQEMYGAATGASAGIGPDGGFLIQTDFANDLVKDGQSESVLASRCASTELSGNADSLEVSYIDETSRATGSRWGGVQLYRAAEADTVTATKPKLGKWELRLEDIRGLFYSTARLDRDASALGQVVSEAFRDEFAFVIDDEIFRGNGVARCQGILTAGATVSVAKETGQIADTIVAENIIKMWSRVAPRSRTRGIWVYNAECEVQLQQMQIGTGTSAQLVYMPAGGLSQAPHGSIYGRPAIAIEQASALGDLGDIAFLDLSRYHLITKGGIQEDQSPHVRFIYWENTWRWSVSINGAPKDKSALTPYKGASTVSPFVTLAARA